MSEPQTDYDVDDAIAEVQAEYAELVGGAIEAFQIAHHRSTDATWLNSAPLLAADLIAWEPSGVTADDLTALRDFMLRLVGFAVWQGDAFRGGEVYGRYLFGIPEAE